MENGSEERLLEGWKEVAKYLNRSIRTVQRWKKTYGLPVTKHEVLGVVAVPSELEDWRRKFRREIDRDETVAASAEADASTKPVSGGAVVEPPEQARGRIDEATAVVPELSDEDQLGGARESTRSPAAATTRASFRPLPSIRGFLRIVLTAALILTALGVSITWIQDKQLEVTRFEQLTNDGLPKFGPVFTDGRSVYFETLLYDRREPMSVAVTGGVAQRLNIPLGSAHILDISPNDKAFLVSGRDPERKERLWRWRPGEPAESLAMSNAQSGTWLGIPHRFADASSFRLRVFDGAAFTSIKTEETVLYPRWEPGGSKLRFTTWDARHDTKSLWEITQGRSAPYRMPDQPPDACCGSWMPDASFYVFQVGTTGKGEIWARHERFTLLPHRHPQSFRVATGAMEYLWPTPGIDGRSLFFIGQNRRGVLVSRKATGEFSAYLGGLSAIELDWSRTRPLIAYISFPDRTLWTMDLRGGNRTQLTWAPMVAYAPHWSPDGSEIAFMGESAGRFRIYVIRGGGGAPKEVARNWKEDQGVPTWSPDGSRLIFGDLQYRHPQSEMDIKLVDVRTGAVTRLSDRRGVWTPRWSPDGRWIVAMTPDFTKLLLYDLNTNAWRNIASMRSIDDPAWTADSRYVYFRALDDTLPANETVLAVYRIDISTGTIEQLASMKNISPPLASHFGVTPDGTIIGMREVGVQEIYKARLER